MATALLSAHEREEIRVGLEAAESFTDPTPHRPPSKVRHKGGRLHGGGVHPCRQEPVPTEVN